MPCYRSFQPVSAGETFPVSGLKPLFRCIFCPKPLFQPAFGPWKLCKSSRVLRLWAPLSPPSATHPASTTQPSTLLWDCPCELPRQPPVHCVWLGFQFPPPPIHLPNPPGGLAVLGIGLARVGVPAALRARVGGATLRDAPCGSCSRGPRLAAPPCACCPASWSRLATLPPAPPWCVLRYTCLYSEKETQGPARLRPGKKGGREGRSRC